MNDVVFKQSKHEREHNAAIGQAELVGDPQLVTHTDLSAVRIPFRPIELRPECRTNVSG